MADEKRMAIISEVGIGLRDVGRPVLWFTVHLDESSAALQVKGWEETAEIIKDHGVYDVKNLNGKACWVEEDQRIIRYLGACRIGGR